MNEDDLPPIPVVWDPKLLKGVHTVPTRKMDVVVDALRRAILSFELAPGSRIRQYELADSLGVSRLPVRQALQELAAEGLVELHSHASAIVKPASLPHGIELYQIREALEPAVAADSAAHSTPELIQALQRHLERLDELVGDPAAWINEDEEFHRTVNSRCELPFALELSESLHMRTQIYRRHFVLADFATRTVVAKADHTLIVDAFSRADPVDAAERSRLHIRRARLALTEVLATTMDQGAPLTAT